MARKPPLHGGAFWGGGRGEKGQGGTSTGGGGGGAELNTNLLRKYSLPISLEPLVSQEQRQVGKSLGNHLGARLSVTLAEQCSSQSC